MFNSKLLRLSSIRGFQTRAILRAKGDQSTIDSFRLPSQTSINEWEFKYDFIPKTGEPKVPPVTKEAIKQDIAQEKAKQVATELFAKESNSSLKVEGSSATVLHGGEAVSEEPEFLHDRGSDPIDSSRGPIQEKAKKPANRDQYVQTSINPNINNSDVVNLSGSDVHHKNADVEKQTPVVDDLEHDNLHHSKAHQSEPPKDDKGVGLGVPLALIGAGGIGYYYYSSKSEKAAK